MFHLPKMIYTVLDNTLPLMSVSSDSFANATRRATFYQYDEVLLTSAVTK